MDINATLLVQMVVFALFIWFTMKFVWPPICRALDEREQKISDGLAAAERGQRDYELSQQRVAEVLQEAKANGNVIIEKAHHRAQQILDESREQAKIESERRVKQAQEQIAQAVAQAKQALMHDVASLAIEGAERIVQQNLNDEVNHALVESMLSEL